MKQIYLAGGMCGLNFSESNDWRMLVKAKIQNYAATKGVSVKVINPNDYFNFQSKSHETEREVRNFDLNLVRSSDLIIVNFNNPKSIGTAQELAVAYELRIPILGINKEQYELHPWLVECCDRIFTDYTDLVEYVRDFYLR